MEDFLPNAKNTKSPLSHRDFTQISEGYFELLGGKKYPKETTERLIRFSAEIQELRDYKKFTTFKSDVDEMVVINRLTMFSFCEHHLLPFFGYVYIGYIPNGRILGLSKFQRIVDKLASKPSTQEEITQTIADFIDKLLDPKGVAVATNCQHTCMFGRGVRSSDSHVNAQALIGVFKQTDAKSEFLQRIKT